MLLALAAANSVVYSRSRFVDRQPEQGLDRAAASRAVRHPSGPVAADAPALAGTEAYQVLDRTGRVLVQPVVDRRQPHPACGGP